MFLEVGGEAVESFPSLFSCTQNAGTPRLWSCGSFVTPAGWLGFWIFSAAPCISVCLCVVRWGREGEIVILPIRFFLLGSYIDAKRTPFSSPLTSLLVHICMYSTYICSCCKYCIFGTKKCKHETEEKERESIIHQQFQEFPCNPIFSNHILIT